MLRLFFMTILFLFPGIIISQETSQLVDQKYGPDPLLYNGRKYTYYLPSGTQGHQFYNSADFKESTVIIAGKRFEKVFINYDLYNQQLLMKTNDPSAAGIIIELSKAWLEGFHLDGKDFILFGKGDEKRFYQVLGEGPVFILFYFTKNIKLDATYGTTQYAFKPAEKSMYLLRENDLTSFRNNRSFINTLKEDQQIELKKYLKKNKINVKKASDSVMLEMIRHLNKL